MPVDENERGHKYAKRYVSTTGGTTPSSTTGGAFQIKTELVGANWGETVENADVDRIEDDRNSNGYCKIEKKRCRNCDQPNFTQSE